MIAEQRLQPEVREQVNILLGRTSFVKASMWADEVRGKETLKIKFMTHVGCRKFFLKA